MTSIRRTPPSDEETLPHDDAARGFEDEEVKVEEIAAKERLSQNVCSRRPHAPSRHRT